MVPTKTIASQPPRGWHGSRSNQSIKALKWLAWQEHQLRLQQPAPSDPIRSIRNMGEQRVANYLVDGYDPTTQTVYEFHSCLWHGCPDCFPVQHDRYPICHTDRTLKEVYEATLKKHELLQQRGYHLQVKWECDWDQDVKTNPDLQQFLNTFEIVKLPNPRHAFFGGRTNAVKLHHAVEPGEEIEYINITRHKYPVGHPVEHPEVIVNPEDQDIHHYFRVALVDILPPYQLYHPVLPFCHRGKLTFLLCRTCVEEEMSKPLLEKSHRCSHTPEQRTLQGTWCTPELHKAVEMGYRLLKIHEVWHFRKRQKGLFADYVNTSKSSKNPRVSRMGAD